MRFLVCAFCQIEVPEGQMHRSRYRHKHRNRVGICTGCVETLHAAQNAEPTPENTDG